MKNIISISLITCALCLQVSTAQTIPNAGFETWNWIGGWFENPDGWSTNNNQIITHVEKDTLAYAGNFAVKVLMGGFTKTIFPVTMNPGYLKAFVKTTVMNIDTVSINVTIFSGGNITDTGTWINTNLNPLPNWTQINIPITQNNSSADSIEIIIEGGNELGTMISADDLKFDSVTFIHEQDLINGFTVYPNPVIDQINILFSPELLSQVKLELYNPLGQIVKFIADKKLIEGENKISFSTENIPKGIYHLKFSVDGNTVTKKIVKM